MSISTPPPPAAPKKRGMGCLGCGCAFLILLALLLLAFVGGTVYFSYVGFKSLSSPTPSAVTSYNGSDDLYKSVRQKLVDFDHDVKNHQSATISLSADEINTMIARAPDVAKNNIQAYVTFANGQARMQASIPTDALSQGAVKGRYFNFDTTFEIHYDVAAKGVNLSFHTLQVNDKPLLGGGDSGGPSPTVQAMMSGYMNQQFNAGIRKNPDGAALLDQARSIEIKDDQLVIQTQ